ncbi:MAG: AEC family transporter [Burkholderiales bacterium]|nr:AEC family transporter [Anaerolineae bacterium]
MLEIISIFVDNIVPLLAISGVGFFAGIKLRLDPKPIGRMLFYFLSPSLVFSTLYRTQISGSELWLLIAVMALFVACMTLIAYVIMRLQGADKVARAGVILSAMSPNNGNFGLPMINFAFGPEVFARAVIVYVATTLLNYSVGIYVASNGRRSAKDAVRSIARVPTLYMAIGGLIINTSGIALPTVLDRTVALLAQATIPLMLLLLGLQMAQSARISQFRLVGTAVGLRLLVAPFVAAALTLLLGLSLPASIAVIMQASMPVAVATIVFASEFKLDTEQMSGTVIVSTLLSPVTLSILILILQQMLRADS